jgi:hypothetical protein
VPDANQAKLDAPLTTPDLGIPTGTGGTGGGGAGGTVGMDASIDHTATVGPDAAGTGGAAGMDASIDRTVTGGTDAVGTREEAGLDVSTDQPAPGGPDSGMDAAADAGGGLNADANHDGGEVGAFTCPSPTLAWTYNLPKLGNIAWDKDGSLITGQSFYPGTAQSGFGPTPATAGVAPKAVTNKGSADILVAKIDPNSGNASWVFTAGAALDQEVTEVAASSAGLGVIGTFTGTLDIFHGSQPNNILVNPETTAIDYIAGLTDDGVGAWAMQADLGGGKLNAIAGQSGKDYFVVCGSAMNNASDLSSTGTTGIGTPGGDKDVVVAAVKASDGTILWSKLFGGPMNQLCTAAALDDDGNALFAGTYTGSLNFGSGALAPAPTGASDQVLWVAKLNGATGATITAKTFGTSGQVIPNWLTADAKGNVIVAGQFATGVAFGNATLTPLGDVDAFVVKLDSSLLPSSWARRWGGSPHGQAGCNGVAVDSTGNVTVVGEFSLTADVGPGTTILTSPSSAILESFVVNLDGETGQSLCAHGYGDVASGGGGALAVAINRWATGASQDSLAFVGNFTGTINFGPPTTALSGAGNATAAYLVRM